MQAAALMNLVLLFRQVRFIPMDLQIFGAETICKALSKCITSEHGELIRDLAIAARSMLINFTIMYNEHGYEQSWTTYLPIANLLELEGEESAEPLSIPSFASDIIFAIAKQFHIHYVASIFSKGSLEASPDRMKKRVWRCQV